MKKTSVLAAACLSSGLLCCLAGEAHQLAERMASKYAGEEFYFSPAASGEQAGAWRLLLPVNAGLEYLVLLASDQATCNAAVRVEDDAGHLIIADDRPGPLAGARFAPQADGTAVLTIVLRKSSGNVGWHLITGRRALPQAAAPARSGSTDGPEPGS